MFKKFKLLLSIVFFFLLLSSATFAAETDTYGLNRTAIGAGLVPAGAGAPIDLAARIGAIVGNALSFVGVVFLILMIYGGFIWMTARGEQSKVKDATAIIRNAAIGLVIIAMAYVITNFVLTAVISAPR